MLSLVHLIYMAGDKCMRQNACLEYAAVTFRPIRRHMTKNVFFFEG